MVLGNHEIAKVTEVADSPARAVDSIDGRECTLSQSSLDTDLFMIVRCTHDQGLPSSPMRSPGKVSMLPNVRLLRHGLPLMAAACLCQEAFSQSQILPIISCTSSPPAVPGFECHKAFDGNPATEWRVQAMSGSGQTIRLNLATTPALRRVKKITATWGTAPNEFRQYKAVDKNNQARGLESFSGPQTTDQMVVNWGEDLIPPGGNMVWQSQAVIIEVYSSAVAGLREITIAGPGIYSDNQILTATIPIPAWDISFEQDKTISLGTIPFSRIVGASAFLFGDDNSVHNLTNLVPYPANVYNYPGGGPPPIVSPATHAPSGMYLDAGSNQIFLDGRSFRTDPLFNDPAKSPRGYVSVRYLSQDPEF